jgi:hypothetical protein
MLCFWVKICNEPADNNDPNKKLQAMNPEKIPKHLADLSFALKISQELFMYRPEMTHTKLLPKPANMDYIPVNIRTTVTFPIRKLTKVKV